MCQLPTTLHLTLSNPRPDVDAATSLPRRHLQSLHFPVSLPAYQSLAKAPGNGNTASTSSLEACVEDRDLACRIPHASHNVQVPGSACKIFAENDCPFGCLIAVCGLSFLSIMSTDLAQDKVPRILRWPHSFNQPWTPSFILGGGCLGRKELTPDSP